MDILTEVNRGLLVMLINNAPNFACPYTGEALDVRTCAYVVDADGLASSIMGPTAGKILQERGLPASLIAQGCSLVVQS